MIVCNYIYDSFMDGIISFIQMSTLQAVQISYISSCKLTCLLSRLFGIIIIITYALLY